MLLSYRANPFLFAGGHAKLYRLSSIIAVADPCICVLQDALAQGQDDAALRGTRIILPSSFIGGERHMQQQFQDAMSIVRHYGSPSVFTTFTCNPTWPEITDHLLSGQSAKDRPDLTARVFKLKLREYIRDIRKRGIYGRAVADVYVIEFQKRGLPHAHLIVILKAEDRPRSPADCDRFVSAEIPDPEQFPAAHAAVVKHMMHGPCGPLNPSAPCMKDGRCSKGYPKPFLAETNMSESGQPQYRRYETLIISLKHSFRFIDTFLSTLFFQRCILLSLLLTMASLMTIGMSVNKFFLVMTSILQA